MKFIFFRKKYYFCKKYKNKKMELSLDLTKRYTLADYITWMDDERRELIDGFISLMAAPSYEHADVVRNVICSFNAIVKNSNGDCKVYCARSARTRQRRSEVSFCSCALKCNNFLV